MNERRLLPLRREGRSQSWLEREPACRQPLLSQIWAQAAPNIVVWSGASQQVWLGLLEGKGEWEAPNFCRNNAQLVEEKHDPTVGSTGPPRPPAQPLHKSGLTGHSVLVPRLCSLDLYLGKVTPRVPTLGKQHLNFLNERFKNERINKRPKPTANALI